MFGKKPLPPFHCFFRGLASDVIHVESHRYPSVTIGIACAIRGMHLIEAGIVPFGVAHSHPPHSLKKWINSVMQKTTNAIITANISTADTKRRILNTIFPFPSAEFRTMRPHIVGEVLPIQLYLIPHIYL